MTAPVPPERSPGRIRAGVLDGQRVRQALHLPPGATLVAYSDGLVERPDADLDSQLRLLRKVVHVHTDAALARAAQQVAVAILGVTDPRPDRRAGRLAIMVI